MQQLVRLILSLRTQGQVIQRIVGDIPIKMPNLKLAGVAMPSQPHQPVDVPEMGNTDIPLSIGSASQFLRRKIRPDTIRTNSIGSPKRPNRTVTAGVIPFLESDGFLIINQHPLLHFDNNRRIRAWLSTFRLFHANMVSGPGHNGRPHAGRCAQRACGRRASAAARSACGGWWGDGSCRAARGSRCGSGRYAALLPPPSPSGHLCRT